MIGVYKMLIIIILFNRLKKTSLINNILFSNVSLLILKIQLSSTLTQLN